MLYTQRTVFRCQTLHDSEDIEKSATKTNREEVRRTVGKMLMKRELRQLLVIIDAFSDFFRELNRRSKSSHESMEFWLDCQRTKCFGHLNDVLSNLNDRELFQKLGLHVKGCTEAPFLHGVVAESPEAEAANDLCQPVGRVILAVTSRRLRSCVVHTWYLHKFVSILDEGLATGILNDIREDEELFHHLKTLLGPF